MSPTPTTSQDRKHISAWGRTTSMGGTLLLATLVAIAGCGGSGKRTADGVTPSVPAATVLRSGSSETLHPTKRQRAVTAAATQVHRYERLLSELAVHKDESLNRLDSVSTEPDLAEEIRSLNRFREAHDRQSGIARITDTRVIGVSLTSHPNRHPRTYPTVRVTTCVDVKGVHGYGPSGGSIVAKNRKSYLFTHLTLVNRTYPRASGWLVSKVSDREQNSCGR
jgi:hypothetical protein